MVLQAKVEGVDLTELERVYVSRWLHHGRDETPKDVALKILDEWGIMNPESRQTIMDRFMNVRFGSIHRSSVAQLESKRAKKRVTGPVRMMPETERPDRKSLQLPPKDR